MKTRLEKAIEYLANYCDKRNCRECRLSGKGQEVCLFECIASDWPIRFKEMETTYARKKTD